jgi:CubicO group peptidase (beta-lactamase class C family)
MLMHVYRASAWATLGVLILLLVPEVSRADSIDRYIRAEMTNQRIPGLALAVIRIGRPVKVATYGVANVELQVAVTPKTVFRLASLSKQIIATGIMLLVADGKLTVDEPACQFLPQCPQAWEPVTIRQLLSHTSGLPMEAPGNDPLRPEPLLAAIRRAYAVPLLSRPGTRWSYSNLGYGILLQIIEKVTDRPWSEFFNQRIFQPLGMKDTRITSVLDIIPNRASGYVFRDDKLHNVAPLIAMRPGGAFVSTLADMIKWDAAITNHVLLSRALQQQTWTPVLLADGISTHYGFGWWADEVRGHRRVRHGGSEPGWRTEYTRFVDDHVDVIVLANGASVRPDDIAVAVAGHYASGLSIERKTVTLGSSVLAAYAGRYELSPANILKIAVDGPGLSIESSNPLQGSGEWRMLPASSDTFFISPDESYVFVRESGHVVRLEIRYGNTVVTAKRLP